MRVTIDEDFGALMSTPQNPYEPNNGSGNQNPNGPGPDNQPPNAPGFSGDQNSAPQYGSQSNGQQPPQYGSQNDPNQQPQYGSQPQYGQPNDPGAPGYDQNQGGYGQGYDPNAQGYNQDPYGQNQDGYGQGYDPNAQGYDPNAQGYDANQYGQQPAYVGADGSSDQFIPANPNASYGSYSAGSGGNKSKNIWGILALVGGIAGIVLSIFFGIGFLFGVAGVIFAFVGLSAIKKGLANNKGMTITGMILSFIAILFSIISVIVTFIFGGLFISAIDEAANEASSSASPIQNQSEPAQDPSQGADPSDGGEEAAPPPVEEGGVEIGTDLTAAVRVQPGTASDTAAGAEDSNGQIAVVTVTVENNSSSDVDLSTAQMSANDGAGKEYDDVFQGTEYKASLVFDTMVPAGSKKSFQLAYGVPSADLDKVHLKLSLGQDLGKGEDFEFTKDA
ncbi:DUF4352 domain-containing protein [Brevibacterium aurantiacum]|uniref:DUF4352 domain-containing protein n=3 Tax=Brevibacterium aurantiacum TaxID=273384 RepID=A0A2A3X909_BREAU|nr:DUF4352 domain-containing protein [Brevibacterium aurantiacum]PCC20190.1 DUF4352 domain-containing protein [Brevibacterium aurantiacum]PCC43506.1 DUF4352 domain-containing protein [Brevibacterium aurantiacum]PCC47087.1 DUF4352 domain-containing protein [Brevibacterium aurantiacum]RCS95936.1 DUF4352 domain-containing protein [Brevibacterium aurantiacum]